ncbi:hypothetical protein EYF80_059885 [Liparis tanakae]|uniref:Uncharacterized protein n=1 Tax=Liparis tanakae TaxID=230148 RepID=A0A4Z2ENB3_9TELE|nr:hypothetical protein EYF80_059885 [Liparis tanakae]
MICSRAESTLSVWMPAGRERGPASRRRHVDVGHVERNLHRQEGLGRVPDLQGQQQQLTDGWTVLTYLEVGGDGAPADVDELRHVVVGVEGPDAALEVEVLVELEALVLPDVGVELVPEGHQVGADVLLPVDGLRQQEVQVVQRHGGHQGEHAVLEAGPHRLGCSLCLTSRYLSVAMKDWAWKPLAVPVVTGVWQMAPSVPTVATLLLSGVPR